MFNKTSLIIVVLALLMSLTACDSQRIVETLPLDNENVTENVTKNDKIPIVNIESETGNNASTTENDENEPVSDESATINDENESASNENDNGQNNIKSEKTYDVIDPEPGNQEVEITLYYSNYEYIMTGDESLDIIIPVKKSVMVGERPIEEIVVAELQNEPEDEKLTSSLAGLDILSVDSVHNIAYVNISSKDLNGGSLTETLVLQQLVYSLTELDDVESVQILVDGSKRESLMGHITIQEPLTRADSK